MIKAVILVGGPSKGTRFRPLSFNSPKPLFPIAGLPTIEHLIKACVKIPNMKEIFLLGFFQQDDLDEFVKSVKNKYHLNVRYLQEYAPLGTAGGIYHFRDIIRLGDPEAVFLINGDVCGNFNLSLMLDFHKKLPQPEKLITILSTEATNDQSLDYGCIVQDKKTHEMLHYTEKPSSFVSNTINCGVYLFEPIDFLKYLSEVFNLKHKLSLLNDTESNGNQASMSLENDVFKRLQETKRAFIFQQKQDFWWTQIKSSNSAIYSNRNYLLTYRKTDSKLLAENKENGPIIVGDVFIDKTAIIDKTAKIGPNVSIGEGVRIGAGVRVKNSIILKNANIKNHSLIKDSVIGWNCFIGEWCRIEGKPCEPNPNQEYAKMDNKPLFDSTGKLNPLVTVLGSDVNVKSEMIILNSVVLPQKEINGNYKNEIIL